MHIAKAGKTLMIREPFYGLFLSSLNKIITDSVPTLAVGLDGINTNLYINENFWNSLTDTEQIAVLKHELIHICFFHLTLRSSFANNELFNIAADLEVNQLITGLPEGCVTLDYFKKQGIDLPPRAGTRLYYDILKNELKNNPDLLNGLGNDSNGNDDGSPNYGDGSGHEKWKQFDQLTEAEKKLVENQTDYVLKSTADTVMKNQGTIPGELRSKIDSLFEQKPQIFNWKAYLRRLLGNSNFVYTKKTLRKLSKRFEDSAGIKIKQKTNILVAIDTSGSINDAELADFFSEINYIYKSGAKVTILECDAKIGRVYEYKGKYDSQVTGGGGTDFAPVINYYNDHRSDFTTLVFFTDGYASLTNFKLMKKMIWVISSNGKEDKYPGLTINIPKR